MMGGVDINTFGSLKKEHQDNLITLRDGLVSMYGTAEYHSNFGMKNYQVGRGRHDSFTKHTCNTSACVLGHGPIFGIGSVDFSYWQAYCRDFFGIDGTSPTWEFLFGTEWDNNIQEAIARLSLYIDGFDPENEDWCYDDLYVK